MPEAYQGRRIRRAERMDQPGLDPAQRQAALEGLRRLSRWPGQRAPLLAGLEQLLGSPQAGLRRLVELGAGSADLSGWVAERLRARGHRVEVLATDRVAGPGVARLDVTAGPLPEADVYFSNLLLHHLDDRDLEAMLRAQAAACRVGLLHYDLHRHWAHFYGARCLLWAGGMPPIVQEDGPTSIQQGYTRAELIGLAQAALPGAELRWCWPFRWRLAWRRA